MPEALTLLRRAYDYARQLKRDVWDFAVEVLVLRRVGLTNSDYRWLLCNGYVDHADEITLPGQDGRAFRRLGNLSFSKRTCFVLTESGAAFAEKVCGRPTGRSEIGGDGESGGDNGAVQQTPEWDRDRQELRLGRIVVKQFKVPAPNQETILAAFEEERWPPRIDDPLPPQAEQDAKRRLHDTINGLNKNQKSQLLHFLGDGSGQGIRWELIPPRRRRSGSGP